MIKKMKRRNESAPCSPSGSRYRRALGGQIAGGEGEDSEGDCRRWRGEGEASFSLDHGSTDSRSHLAHREKTRQKGGGEEEEDDSSSLSSQGKEEVWKAEEGRRRRRSRSAGEVMLVMTRGRDRDGEEEESMRSSSEEVFLSCLLRDLRQQQFRPTEEDEDGEGGAQGESEECRRRGELKGLRQTSSLKTAHRGAEPSRTTPTTSYALSSPCPRRPVDCHSSGLNADDGPPDASSARRSSSSPPPLPRLDGPATESSSDSKKRPVPCLPLQTTPASPNLSRTAPPPSAAAPLPWYKRFLLFRKPPQGNSRSSAKDSPPHSSSSSSSSSFSLPPTRSFSREERNERRHGYAKVGSTSTDGKRGNPNSSNAEMSFESSSSQSKVGGGRSLASFQKLFSAKKSKPEFLEQGSSSSSRKWEGGVVTARGLSLRTQGSQMKRRRTAGMKSEKSFEWKPVLVREFGYGLHKVVDIALGGTLIRMLRGKAKTSGRRRSRTTRLYFYAVDAAHFLSGKRSSARSLFFFFVCS